RAHGADDGRDGERPWRRAVEGGGGAEPAHGRRGGGAGDRDRAVLGRRGRRGDDRAGGLFAFAVARVAQAKIGGQTGDILGASQQLAEVAALAAAAAALA
ncbi:hypothetical protein FAZ78_24215, partial [Cereibacter changlensis]